MKFLVFTTDVIPLPGFSTSGTALRTWGIAQGLKSHGHEVVISVPKPALHAFLKANSSTEAFESIRDTVRNLESLAFNSGNQSQIISEVNPDVIICGHWPALTIGHKPKQPIVVDLAGPHLLERHYQKSPNQLGATLAKLSVIGSSDFFIVSGPTQRLYFLSYLLRAEIPDATKRICNITMALNPELPLRNGISNNEIFPRIIFGGVFLPWQDPSFALNHLGKRLETADTGSLTLVGGKHPNYPIEQGVYAELFARLSKNPRVKTKPLLSYEKFSEELQAADVALDLMSWNLERQLAVTIRTTTYLWAGVPVIYNDFADLSKLISKYNAGWTIPADDPQALDNVFDELWSSPGLVEEKSKNAQQLARTEFSWDRAVLPLLSMLGTSDLERSKEIDILFDFPGNAELLVTKDRPIKQTFVCRMNGLAKVECRIATHDRQIKHPLRFDLFETDGRSAQSFESDASASSRLVASKTALPEEIRNNDWLALEVPFQADSAGRSFTLEVSSVEENNQFAASPWALNTRPYPLLSLRHGSKAVENTALCLRTVCINSIQSN